MATVIGKPKGNRVYYYVAESARVDGKPRIVNQTYLGTAEALAALVKDRATLVPLSATTIEFGLPGALWLAAQQSGVWEVLESLWPKPHCGPSTAHYLLLAAIHPICEPGRKLRCPTGTATASCIPSGVFPQNDPVARRLGSRLSHSVLPALDSPSRIVPADTASPRPLGSRLPNVTIAEGR